ncbi:uncharacterized protein LOC118319874 [Scophthalmus maximus]|uniref:uncharacterized protein LOC118319874 n=1 Tax=Scophthalmus maximus TaxID=52904 RepID=UPI001FA8989D|nr:uncharacterized protein LOC118319874 [Scophthalmus maximus]
MELDTMSKTDILRAIIAEKLTTAAQEILAVVERTVAGYEEEAAGFRWEIDRQRRQLELLLPAPDIKLEATDEEQQFPVSQPGPAEASVVGGGGGERPEEQEQHKYELSAEEDGIVNILCYTGEFMELEQEEEEQAAAATPTREQEPVTELDGVRALRSRPPTVQSDRQSAGRLQISKPQNLVDLRIRILGDSGIEVLSTNVYKMCPLQELQCPRGLRETDFLDLLRSTFPQLAGDKPIDIFTTDRSRRLMPLRVKRLTPEMIYRASGHSTLYIRLKDQEELQSFDEFHPSQTNVAAPVSPSSLDQTRVESDCRTTPGRSRVSEPGDCIDFKLRIIEDPQVKILSKDVNEKYPLQELQCPGGLRESDFLDLLRSTFPQLAGDKPFDLFTANRCRKLHPLRVKALTPEEVLRTIKSSSRSFLYIRLKPLDELQITGKDLPSPSDETSRNTSVSSEKTGAATSPRSHVHFRIWILEDSQISLLSKRVFQNSVVQNMTVPLSLQETDFLELLRSTFPQLAGDKPIEVFRADKSKRLRSLRVNALTPEVIQRSMGPGGPHALYIRLKRSLGRLRTSDRRRHVDLKIYIVEDSQMKVLPAKMYKKYPMQELQCPRGMSETDFLDLLRSTFPQLAAYKRFDFFTTDRSRRLLPLRVETLAPEEINRNIWSNGCSALYIQLKASEEAQASGETLHQIDGATDLPATSDQTIHTSTSTSQRTGGGDVKIEVDSDKDYERSESRGLWPRLVPESKRDEMDEEVNDGARKPERPDENLSNEEPEGMKRRRRAIPSFARGSTGRAPLFCKVCRFLRGNVSFLTKHSWSHVDDPRRLCGVCGKRSASAEELRRHLQGHQKTHSCHTCGKSFLSTAGLRGHVARCKGEKLIKCNICHKAYTENRELINHMLVHTAEKPHHCDVCQKTYVSKKRLRLHRATHAVQGRFSCSVCAKSYLSLRSLSHHALTHSARSATGRERKQACGICGKKFRLVQRLQLHVRNHGVERQREVLAKVKCGDI